ncbi:MAG: kelch repeat-containing protein, partial [Acidobacteriota bacterium]
MARARHHHTATLLPTGEVLVVGGDTSPARSSAQLFDYRTGRWTILDGLAIGRSRHTATLVDAAQVWVIGGTDHPDDRRPLASVERFDLETRSWSSAPELTTARWGHTTTRLPSGDLLVVGGSIQPNDFNFDALSSVERFDRSLGSWQPAAPLRRSRVFHTATLLRDGTVLVVGGQVDGLGFSTSAEVYDPITDVWRKVDDMARPRRGHTATLLPTGEVLVAGGSSNTPETGLVSVDSVEIYDPRDGRWRFTGFLDQARYLHTAALLPSGQVLVIGGSEFDLLAGVTTTPIASTEVYDPIRGIWTPVDSMSGGRAEGSSVVLPDGRVLVVGGERVEAGVEATPLSSAEIYDPVIPVWVERAELPGSRWDHTATPLLSGGVLVVGGRAPDPLATTARYEPGTDTWHTIASLESPRSGHTATRLDADRVLVVGGRGLDGSSLDTAEVYEPSRRAWLPATKLPVPFDLHTATRLASGDVLVTGGGQAALFDQTTETWITLPPPAVRRSRHTATLLRSGKVLVAGGGDGNDPSAELYDPESRSWSATGPMRLDRDRHTASLLPSDRVLVAGGFNGGPVGRAELYDPVTNTWAEAAPSQLAAFDRVAGLMPSGRILLAGGGDRLPDGSTAAAEVYDPATERWHSLPALAETTREATATVLDSGAVLIVGGQQDDGNATNRVALLQTDVVERVDRPRIDDAPSVLRYGDPLEGPALTVRGAFSGNSDAGDGTSGHVAANVPMIRMTRLGADDQVWLAPDQLVTIEPPWDDDVRDEPSTLT